VNYTVARIELLQAKLLSKKRLEEIYSTWIDDFVSRAVSKHMVVS
jgi:vacuolar-type H+-ATPase subunit C/Vma6